MQTPDQQVNGEAFVIPCTNKQLAILTAITNDKKVLEDRLNDNGKRETDIINILFEIHSIDPSTVKSVQFNNGELIVFKHPIEKGSSNGHSLDIHRLKEVVEDVDKPKE